MKRADIKEVARIGSLSIEIRQYADGRYGFDFIPTNGERIRIRAKTKSRAVEKAEQLMGKGQAGKLDIYRVTQEEMEEFLRFRAMRRKNEDVGFLVDEFLDSKERAGVSIPTMRELKSSLVSFKNLFKLPILNVEKVKVEDWMDAKKIGPRRFNNIRAAVRALYRYARNHGFLPAELTPVEMIEKRRARTIIQTYSPAELKAVLSVVPEEWRPLIVLGAFAGIRPEEVAPDLRIGKPGLTWQNVLWDKKKIDVPEHVAKDRRRRFAVLTDAAAAWLPRDKKGPVVPQENYNKRKRGWMKAAGTQWKRDAWRHSYASYRLAIIEDIQALSLEMGNSRDMLFRHYLDLKHRDEADEWFSVRP